MPTEMNIQEKKQSVVNHFLSIQDWEEKYKLIIDFGKRMPPLHEIYKTEENRIKGCQSQVWLRAEFKDGRVYFQADSDASITKGIIALLLQVYSGTTPDEILGLDTSFLQEVGITDHLSMSRSNGLASMAKQIHIYAYAFKLMQQQKKS